MRVLFIGDVHFKHGNITETSVLMEKLQNLGESYDFAVIAGDVLDSHEKIDVQLMNRAYDLVRLVREKSHVFICVGNHDMINNQQFLTDNHWMNGMKEWKNVTIVDKPINLNGFVFAPYVFPGRFVDALETIEWANAVCIFAHQEIRGCKMGAIKSIEGDVWDNQWPLVISGHIHERQQPQSNVLYPGSVLEQGLSIFTFGETFGETRISLGIAPKKTVYVKAGQGIKLSDMNQGARVVISGTVDEIASHKKSKQNDVLSKKGVKVVYKLDGKSAPYLGNSAGTSFTAILESLVVKAGDETLSRDYLAVVSN